MVDEALSRPKLMRNLPKTGRVSTKHGQIAMLDLPDHGVKLVDEASRKQSAEVRIELENIVDPAAARRAPCKANRVESSFLGVLEGEVAFPSLDHRLLERALKQSFDTIWLVAVLMLATSMVPCGI